MTRNSRRLQKAVQAIFNDYREKASCPGHVYQNAACGCDNALQMWRGPKGEKGDKGDKGDPGDHAGSFLTAAEFVVNPAGQAPGSYLKLTLRMADETETVLYVNLSELEDVYAGGNGIDITSMVVAAKLGAGLTFDQQGNIASAYQFCDGLDETSNVVKVRLDSSNHILGFASGTCGGLTATVGLAPSATGVNLVMTGADGAVLSTIPLEGGAGITVQKNAQTGGFTWLADPAGLVSSQTGNQLSVSQTDNKLYVGGNTLEYTFGTGAFTLKDSSGDTLSSVTVPTAVKSLERADMVCTGENAPYLHLTFKRDNGQNIYQDVDMSCLATAELSLDAHCEDVVVTPATSEPFDDYILSGNVDTLLLEQDGTISDLLHHNEIPSSSTARGSFTMELFNARSTDGLAIALYAKQQSDSNVTNDYSNINDEEDYPTCQTLADFLAAGEQGLPLAYVEESDLSGVTPLAENEKLYASVVSNGNNSYTFTFTIRTEVTEQELTLDLISGDNRVDMKPLLTKIGGNVETKLVPAGDFETATLYDEMTFDPATPDIVFPVVLFSSGPFAGLYDSAASFPPSERLPFTLDGDSVVCEVPSSYSWCESPAVAVIFFVAPDANSASGLDDLLVLSNISSIDATTQTYAFSFNTVQELLDAGGTLPLNVLTSGESSMIVDDFPVHYYLHVELCEAQDGACYRFTVLTGEAETKTVLHLEPSCDTDIDLTPIVIKGVSGELVCHAAHPLNNVYFSRITCYDANKQYIGVCEPVAHQNNELLATLLPGTVYLEVGMSEPLTGSHVITWNTALVDATVGSTTCVDGHIGEVN